MRLTPPNLIVFHDKSKRKRFPIRKWPAFMLVLTFGMLAVALAAGARPWSRNLRTGEVSAARNNYDSVKSQGNSSPLVQALPIQFKVNGFFPGEIRRRAGNYYVTVSNVSGEKDIHLRFDRQGGERMFDVSLTRQRPWRQMIFLAPGAYLLTEANHPRWECRITVTAP